MYKYGTIFLLILLCAMFCQCCFFVYRDLGDHGYLVEGRFETTKDRTLAKSIPYKYVVYKAKKEKYEYEYIYKLDSEQPTNRCLFVKSGLLNEEGKRCNNSLFIC